MYAVIAAGGKQYRVAEGDTLTVELTGTDAGEEITLTPVLVVDGATVVTDAGKLAGATVRGRVTGSVTGPKVTGFTYKSKSNNRRRWGHRQRYDEIEITGISLGGNKAGGKSAGAAKATPKDAAKDTAKDKE